MTEVIEHSSDDWGKAKNIQKYHRKQFSQHLTELSSKTGFHWGCVIVFFDTLPLVSSKFWQCLADCRKWEQNWKRKNWLFFESSCKEDYQIIVLVRTVLENHILDQIAQYTSHNNHHKPKNQQGSFKHCIHCHLCIQHIVIIWWFSVSDKFWSLLLHFEFRHFSFSRLASNTTAFADLATPLKIQLLLLNCDILLKLNVYFLGGSIFWPFLDVFAQHCAWFPL